MIRTVSEMQLFAVHKRLNYTVMASAECKVSDFIIAIREYGFHILSPCCALNVSSFLYILAHLNTVVNRNVTPVGT